MKKPLIIAGALVLFVLAGWFGRAPYRHWKEHRLTSRAQAALDKGDFQGAILDARRALGINDKNADACRVMARVTEKFRFPVALDWWQRVIDMEPHSLSNRLDFALSAMMENDYAAATRCLQAADPQDQATASFQEMAGLVAAGMNNLPLARQHFDEAARLEPGNKEVRINQAVIELQSKDQQVVANALATLEDLANDPVHGKDALRHLAMTAERNHDYVKALHYTNRLLADPKATLEDRLMQLAILKESDDPGFSAYLNETKNVVTKDTAGISRLAQWLCANGMATEAAQWLDGMPLAAQKLRPVQWARANAYMERKDWAGLQHLLANQKWEEDDYLRLAVLARAAREQKGDFEFQANWLAAVQAASGRYESLANLVRMANLWKWDKETENLLWNIEEKYPSEKWALQLLNQTYVSTGNTRGLYKVYSHIVDYDQTDLIAKNNLAIISLLLNLQPERAYGLAQEAYTHYPTNENVAATEAYSLYLQNHPAQALKVLEKLSPAQLQKPGVAVYYALVLEANNEPDEARKYLGIAEKARMLLPEEKALLAEARSPK